MRDEGVRQYARFGSSLPWAFDDLALERLEILTHPENEASQRVAVAGGYRYEGTLRSHQPFKGSRMDSVLFSLIPADLGERSNSP
jgi:RimJ/RimL family protein N-acetyltransferase